MKNEQSWRFQMLGIGFFVIAAILILQTIRIQLSPESETFVSLAEGIYAGEEIEVLPPRGQIYDRKENLLAGNKTVYEIGVDLQFIDPTKGARDISMTLSTVLGLDFNEVMNIVSTPYSPAVAYLPIARSIPSDLALELLSQVADSRNAQTEGNDDYLRLHGLDFRPSLERRYPEQDLGSSVLGFMTQYNQSFYGVEQYYNSLLAGIPQKYWIPFDPNRVYELPDIPSGASLVLTIDREIQAMVENTIDEAKEKYDASSATVIVMEPKTGEILAMASTPRLNLNEYWLFDELYPTPKNADDPPVPYNRAISQSFEPGSVFKIFTMAAALDNGTVERETIFFDPGYYKVGGITINNWDGLAYSEQDMVGCMRYSLNVCLAWIGSEMGADSFYDYMNAFGFGHVTGVDITGEVTGRLKEPGDDDWWPADLGTNTFGQGVSVTPIQIMQAVSALANEGRMVVPHVLKAFVDNGSQIPTHVQYAGSPISKETAENITDILAYSLEKEASNALVDGYRIAGKTGTAEIPTKYGYTREITNASFVGWGPTDDPQFIVYVWIEEPSATPNSIWGSKTAAPVFSQIVERLVVLMDLPPDQVRLSLKEN